MLFTIVPIEQVLGDEQPEGVRTAQPIRASYLGEDVLLNKSDKGDYSVVRLLSTNPQSFLKAGLAPGQMADVRKIELL